MQANSRHKINKEKIKPNRLAKVPNELGDTFKGFDVPKEIFKMEDHLYHVLELQNKHDEPNKRYVVSGCVKKYSEGAWNQIKENGRLFSESTFVVIHDPKIVTETKKKPTPSPSKES